jgi:phage terminase small subunit
MRVRKPALKVVSGPQDSGQAAPAWLPKDAKAEWSVAVADLAARGLLFRGSFGTLASYCV